MQTYVWNPWSILDELERTASAAAGAREWPLFDIEDDDDATTLVADVPGMTDDDVVLTVAGSTLTVQGERRVRDGRYVSRRRFAGAFTRQFRLGEGYDLDAIEARVVDGVLTIKLAKTARARPRRIKLGGGVVEKVKGLLTGDRDKDKPAAA
jgi:HSP20 family protein